MSCVCVSVPFLISIVASSVHVSRSQSVLKRQVCVCVCSVPSQYCCVKCVCSVPSQPCCVKCVCSVPSQYCCVKCVCVCVPFPVSNVASSVCVCVSRSQSVMLRQVRVCSVPSQSCCFKSVSLLSSLSRTVFPRIVPQPRATLVMDKSTRK